MRRITLLRDLRRQYRAFIIDEYQDTNPQHFRLLSRLWVEENRGWRPSATSQWGSTICIVGDMNSQSTDSDKLKLQ